MKYNQNDFLYDFYAKIENGSSRDKSCGQIKVLPRHHKN